MPRCLHAGYQAVFLSLITGILFSATAHAKPSHYAYASVTGLYVSESLPVNYFLEGWDVPLSNGDISEGYAQLEAGYARAGWLFGVSWHNDAHVRYAQDSLTFLHTVKNQNPLETGRSYALDITAEQTEWLGFKIQHRRSVFDAFELMAGVTLLKGSSLISGTLKGDATATSATEYDFNFDVDYYYSQDHLFSREVSAPEGVGYLPEWEVSWQMHPRFSLAVYNAGLGGKMYWEQSPHTVASADSSVKVFNADGYMEFQPVMSGKESNLEYEQTLPSRWRGTARYAFKTLTTELEWHVLSTGNYPLVGIAMPLWVTRVNLKVAPTIETVYLGFTSRWIDFMVGTNGYSPNTARYFTGELTWRVPF